jgi:hypothetical protein
MTILLIAIALMLTGCAQVAQKAIEQTTGVKVDQKGNNVTIQSKEGDSVSVSSNLSDQFKDFPVPDGFKTGQGGGSVSAKGDSMAAAQWTGSSTTDAVTTFYQKSLPAKGWTAGQTMTLGDNAQLIYNKGDQMALINISTSGSNVEINVVLTKSSQLQPTPGR